MFYQQLQQRFSEQLHHHRLTEEPVTIEARILSSEQALGNPSRDDYPLLKGKEFLMEARCLGMVGQAYTDAPACRTSTLQQIADSDLTSTAQRALFIATLNAVQRFLDSSLKTIHCHNDEPERCAEQMMTRMALFEPQQIGLIGLQPAILEALVTRWGAERVQCLDRDTTLRGSSKHGVAIQWGDDRTTEALFKCCDLVLATGSTVVNGSLPQLLTWAEKHQTLLIFYGSSIAGTARLMGLKHWCFEAA